MNARERLGYEGLGILFAFAIALVTLFVATEMSRVGGKFLSLLGMALAVTGLVFFACTTVAMGALALYDLWRQPDEVPLDSTGRGTKMYRDKTSGRVIYQNTAAMMLEPFTVVSLTGQMVSHGQSGPQELSPIARMQGLAMPGSLETFEGSLRERFTRHRGGDGYE